MENLFNTIKITCFVFGMIGIIISLSELMRFFLAKRMLRQPQSIEMISPAAYRRMATAHLSEFFSVLSIAIYLIFMSLLGTR